MVCNTSKCMTEAQLAAIAEAKKVEDMQARNEVYMAALGENDTTDIDVEPIILNDDPYLEIQGMFFNESEITKDEEPAEKLVIEKDVLDRSSGFIVGRFGFAVQNRAKIVFEVKVDGKRVDGYGTNLPYMENGGVYDCPLFNYNDIENTASANKDGDHKIHVKAGLITGIVEGNTKGRNEGLGLVKWGKVKAIVEKDFVIELLPHKIVD